jgi:uncharacterized protein (TIGR03437 family)
MGLIRCVSLLILLALGGFAATFGTVVPVLGGAADVVIDEQRSRLYLVTPSANQILIYATNTNPPRALNPITGCRTPAAAAMSRSGRFLYVTCYDDSAIAVVDLDRTAITAKVTLAAKPEGIAVGQDERVLVTTIGTGQGQQTLLIYDPQAPAGSNVTNVVITPPAPTAPVFPAPAGRPAYSIRSNLLATRDGRLIIGVNNINNTTRIAFVYEVASATVLRYRTVAGVSSVLSVAPDGSRFLAGSLMFDTETLAVLAQQNAANAPFVFPTGNQSNFNLQQNQGGSVFSPDGQSLYTAFNIAPVQNPPARANVSRLLVNDPDNMLIRTGIQMPENLAGKMAITSNGNTMYALSESGFVVIPLSQLPQQPIAMPESTVVMLANDQCGVTEAARRATITVRNAGGGLRMTATASLMQVPATGPIGLGGTGGPGGGGTGGNIIIVLPPVIPGAGVTPQQAGGNVQAAVMQSSPQVQTRPMGNGSQITFQFSPNAARSLGTVVPHDFLIQSPEAVNIPPNVRVYQNNREAEARGEIFPVQLGVSTSEGLVDMLMDTARQRLYISNSGLNRVEVFDIRRKAFLDPIKVGQLPRSMAFGNDGSTLYVASSGSESVSIVNLDTLRMTGRVKFPPLPFSANFSLVTPSVIASSQRGPQMIMSDGTLWRISGDQASPRILNPSVFGTARTIAGPVRTMASTPNGERVLLLAGNGFAYVYDAGVDEYVAGRQILSAPLQGFYGPVAAGPRGQYYLANGIVLNESLTPVGSAPSVTVTPGPVAPTPSPGGDIPELPFPTNLPTRGGPVTLSRPVAAVASLDAGTFARFTQPVRMNQNAAVTDAGMIEVVDMRSGNAMRVAPALEGPLSAVTGNQRVNISGRTMAVDPSGTTAYVLTATGLSIVPLTPVRANERPSINRNGIVNTASYLPSAAPGSLITIFGSNLAGNGSGTPPLATMMGGACVTLNNTPLPLVLTSPSQINAQIPPNLAAGRYSLVVRSIDRLAASVATNLVVARYAPAVFVDEQGRPAIYHLDGRQVTKDAPATRDERLVLYGTGFGATRPRLAPGAAAPAGQAAITDKAQVFFGNPGYRQAEMIVEWSGLMPGEVGVNQVLLYVPGDRLRGEALPVTVRIGGVNSPSAGPAVPKVAVE